MYLLWIHFKTWIEMKNLITFKDNNALRLSFFLPSLFSSLFFFFIPPWGCTSWCLLLSSYTAFFLSIFIVHHSDSSSPSVICWITCLQRFLTFLFSWFTPSVRSNTFASSFLRTLTLELINTFPWLTALLPK